jgi:hypothetical protein
MDLRSLKPLIVEKLTGSKSCFSQPESASAFRPQTPDGTPEAAAAYVYLCISEPFSRQICATEGSGPEKTASLLSVCGPAAAISNAY